MARYNGGWAPYVPVADRRRKAEKAMAAQRKKGHSASPVVIEGRTIARTFWGQAWCDNLETYRDEENRLARGRTYVRNGSVVDLQIAPGRVTAQVCGSELYRVTVDIKPAAPARWRSICRDCARGIDSLVELLQGRFSKAVMERMCDAATGLFPRRSEISFACSCPDYASMCKHVAAALYGVGARLDERPELLFRLRGVEENDLLTHLDAPLPAAAPAAGRLLESDDLGALFGLEMADAAPPADKTSKTRKSTAAVIERIEPTPAELAAVERRGAAGRPRSPPAPEAGSGKVKPGKARLEYELTPDGFVKWWK